MSSFFHPCRALRAWRERQQQKCTVTIDNPRMKIKGKSYRNTTDDPNFPTYIAFFGVPYATPPIGHLRFQPPQPLTTEPGQTPLLKAYNFNHSSLQYGAEKYEIYGDEDCLYLNIYMSKKPEDMPKNSPVLVYIHGGGFQHGSGDIHEVMPDAIVKQNLIFVTVNYRLCLYGFLNTETENCRGNAGLKDQVMALKWIKANIDRFGGDPYNVTISGHSAGATCVNLHMISPLSQGLFHKAIVQGGGIYCPWGYQGVQKRPRRLLAKEYGLENEFRFVLVKVLMDEDAVDLMEVTKKITHGVMKVEAKKLMIFCGPSLEKFPNDAFIPCDVEEMMRTAKPVPLIAGISEQEGYMYPLVKWHRYSDGFHRLVREDHEFVEFLMQNLRWSKETANRLKDVLRNKYFSNLSRSTLQEVQDQLATLNTDIWFRRFYDNFKIGDMNAPYYIYKFWYIANHDQMRYTESGTTKLRIRAPAHGDEINYLYNLRYLKRVSRGRITSDMRHVMEHMCSLWGNFCRNGVPRSEIEPDVVWKAHTEEAPCYLNIGLTSTLVRSRLHEARWRELNAIIEPESTVSTPPLTPDPDFALLNFWGFPKKS